MRKKIVMLMLAGMILSVGGCGSGNHFWKGKQQLTHGQYAQKLDRQIRVSIDYLLYIPEGYDQDSPKQWPLMLFLHGAGERGSDLNKVKVHGPPKVVESRNLPFIIVSPQCPTGQWWPAKVEVLKGLIDEIEENYNVDSQRVYLTGLSMGGFGTWTMACTYPDIFAAIAPICGGGQPYIADRLKDVPVWAFHGAKDNVVPMRRSQEMVDAVNRAGGHAKLTIYPNAGHDAWTETYNNPELYKWFLSHKKGPE